MAQTMYTHVNKCKNDKTKRRKQNKQKRYLVKHTSVCVGRGISRGRPAIKTNAVSLKNQLSQSSETKMHS
jgi:hypothetical protein